jgi:hypothetical protein
VNLALCYEAGNKEHCLPNPKLNGPWSLAEIETFLHSTVIPVRLSAVSSAGWPTVVSLWFAYEAGTLRCASKRSAKVVRLLRSNPRCGFEIARETPPYFGVRGQGTVELDEGLGPKLLPNLVDRYVGSEETSFRRWLLARTDAEVAIVINPIRFMSWDYRKRMQR